MTCRANHLSRAAAICAALMLTAARSAAADGAPARPTVVLLHGAFAGSSSWSGVIAKLLRDGYPVRALALPLRGLESDARYVAAQLDAIAGPVVLVGHSYGGAVMSGAAKGHANVKALVFVSAFAPEEGETAAALTGRFPGSTLGPTLVSVPLPDGEEDLYIRTDRYRAQFAADVPAADAALMAATQRPIVKRSFDERAGPPAWKDIPSWFFFADQDKNIPVAVHRFMAERAKSRRTVEVKGASHAVGVSHPGPLASLIEEAAGAVAEARPGTRRSARAAPATSDARPDRQ